VKEDE
jgi:hypothetical protein